MKFNYTTKWKWEIWPQELGLKPRWIKYRFVNGQWLNELDIYYRAYEA